MLGICSAQLVLPLVLRVIDLFCSIFVGWVSVAGGMKDKEDTMDQFILLRAWTPNAVGISLREPALLPFAVRRRGKRLLYLREYSGVPQDSKYADFNGS